MPTFTLGFWSSESTPPGKAEILDALRHRSHFQAPTVIDGLTHIDYLNPKTRTCFELIYELPRSGDKEGSDAPPGFRHSGLTFHPELPNSSWTAREALSEVVSIATSFRLIVEDVDASRGMHDANGKPNPRPYLEPDEKLLEELLRRWKRSCLHEIAYLRMSGTTVPYVPEELVRRWWEFSSVEHLLQGQVGSRVKTVPMFIAEHPETKEPVTGTAWTVGTATIFPRCDVLLIIQPSRRLLARLLGRAETCLLPYAEVMSALATFLQPFEGPPPSSGLQILTPEQATQAEPAFEKLRGKQVNWKALRFIHEEPFSDLRLAE
jgi:hypothetical protein